MEQVIFVEPPGRIEQRMAETRSRMAPDLVDLRRCVEPQVIKERAQQSVLEYLRSVRTSAPGGRQTGPLAALVVLAAVAALVLRRGSGRGG